MTVTILDPYIPGHSAVHRADPRAKLLVALAWILAINLTSARAWPAYVACLLGWLAVLISARVSPWAVLRRTLVATPFLLLAALGAPLASGGQAIWSASILGWQVTVTDLGLWHLATILARSWLSVLVAVALVTTTPFTELVRGMRRLGLPALLAAIVQMMYRYLFVLVDEAQRLIRARDARSASRATRRGGRSLAWRAGVSGHMIATLFLRTYERSERIYQAMLARGYQGEILALSTAPREPAAGGRAHAVASRAIGVRMSAMPALSLDNLSYAYPDGHCALRDVSLSVQAGERVALVGSNGAGKSTLLLHLNGLLRGEGRVVIAGVPVTEENSRRVRAQVGLVFQDPDDQLFSPTVLDDVAYGPLYMGLPEQEVLERSARALEQVGMASFGERMPHRLSLGERKRASLATVLSMDVDILALDEPSAGLDPAARRNLIDLLVGLPHTMLIATHDLAMARALCTRAVVLREGRLVADGPMEALDESLLSAS